MNIFLTALATVFTNFGTALKVSVVPFVIGMLLSMIIFIPVATTLDVTTLETGGFGFVTFVAIVLFIAVWLIVMGVTAINWHRAILHNEPVGFLPNMSGLPLGRYIGRVIVLSLIMAAIGLVIGYIVTILLGSVLQAGTAGIVIAGVIGFAFLVFLAAFYTRLGSTLPAIAIGEAPTIGDGLTQTQDIQGPIYGAAICTILFGVVIGLISVPIANVPVLSFIYSVASNWLSTMLGLAILTVIYRRTGFESLQR